MKKIRTLQFQITLVVGILLVAVSIILTVNSIYSANNYYGLLQDYEGESIELLPEIAASEAIYDPEMIEEDKVTFADMMISFSVQGLVVMFVTIAASLLIVYWITGKMLRPLL